MLPEQDFALAHLNVSQEFILATTNLATIAYNPANLELAIAYRKASEYDEDLMAFYLALAANPLLMADVKIALFWSRKFNSEFEKIKAVLGPIGVLPHVSDVIGTLSDESRFNTKESIYSQSNNDLISSVSPFTRNKVPDGTNDMIKELNSSINTCRNMNLVTNCAFDTRNTTVLALPVAGAIAGIFSVYMGLVSHFSSISKLDAHNPFVVDLQTDAKVIETDLLSTLGTMNIIGQYVNDDRRKLNIEVLK